MKNVDISSQRQLTEEFTWLRNLLLQIDARPVELLNSGGSPARVVRVRTSRGEELVIKYLFADDGQVDGHDLETFRLKPMQIQRIRDELPYLRPFYSEVLEQFEGPGWSVYSMPFYTGETLTKSLTDSLPAVNLFFRDIKYIVQVLVQFGYAVSFKSTPMGYFEHTHIDRVKRRFWLLERHLPREILMSERLVINGYICMPVPALLRQLENCTDLLHCLQPPKLHYPVHGDANLGNFIIQGRTNTDNSCGINFGFKVLDPRGTLDYRDASYDFAKMLFSLSLFEPAMEGGFEIQRTGEGVYEVQLRKSELHGYLEAAELFLDVLDTIEAYKDLVRNSFHEWRRRILFAHAFHAVAESACRLSDQKERVLGSERGFAVCQELALGLYLAGTLLLNELVHIYEDCNACRPAKQMERLRSLWGK